MDSVKREKNTLFLLLSVPPSIFVHWLWWPWWQGFFCFEGIVTLFLFLAMGYEGMEISPMARKYTICHKYVQNMILHLAQFCKMHQIAWHKIQSDTNFTTYKEKCIPTQTIALFNYDHLKKCPNRSQRRYWYWGGQNSISGHRTFNVTLYFYVSSFLVCLCMLCCMTDHGLNLIFVTFYRRKEAQHYLFFRIIGYATIRSFQCFKMAI